MLCMQVIRNMVSARRVHSVALYLCMMEHCIVSLQAAVGWPPPACVLSMWAVRHLPVMRAEHVGYTASVVHVCLGHACRSYGDCLQSMERLEQGLSFYLKAIRLSKDDPCTCKPTLLKHQVSISADF